MIITKKILNLTKKRPPRSVPKLKDLSLEYLLTMSSHEVQLLLKKLGFQHYTKRVHEMGVTGRDLANCNEFDLNLMGFTYRPHRMRLLAFLDKKRGKVETLKLQFEVSKILNVPLEDPSAIHRLITKREHAQVVQRVESQAEKRTEPEAVETQVQDEQEMQAIDLKQKEKENLRRLATEQYCTAMRSLQMFAGRMASDTEHPTSPSKGGKGQCSLEASIQEDSLALVRMRTQQEFRDVMAKVDQEMNTDVEQAIQEAEVTLSKRKEKRREEFQRTRAAAQQKAESLLKENMRSRYKEIEKENEEKLQEPTEGEGLQAKLLAEQEAIELREAELREEEKSAQELLALIQKQEESAAIKLQCLQRARSSRKTVMIMRGQARTRAREAEQAEALNRDEEELGVLVKLAKESKILDSQRK